MNTAARPSLALLSPAALVIALAACLSAGTAAPAQADVIYTFTQSAPTFSTGGFGPGPGPVPGVVTAGIFILDESLVGAPYTVFASNQANPATTNYAGLQDIFFATTGPAPQPLAAGKAEFTTPAPGNNGFDYTIRLTGIAGALMPTGEIRYNNTESDTRLVIDPDLDGDGITTVRGAFNTDAGGPCGRTGACSFLGTLTASTWNGAQTAVPVPEPASAALFLAGLLGLGAVRHRRR